jgi:hypothetical protein
MKSAPPDRMATMITAAARIGVLPRRGVATGVTGGWLNCQPTGGSGSVGAGSWGTIEGIGTPAGVAAATVHRPHSMLRGQDLGRMLHERNFIDPTPLAHLIR